VSAFGVHRGQHGEPSGRKRVTVVASVLAIVASYGVVGPVSLASADTVVGSSFQIDQDANLTVDGPPATGTIDWLTGGSGSSLRSAVIHRADVPSGTADDSFTQGTAENDALTTIATGSIPNNKSDLKQFGVYQETVGSKTFLNVFWMRVNDPNGTTNMDFEFNQSPTAKNKPFSGAQVIPVRTPGDLLLTYDLDNGGSHAVMRQRRWTGTQWGPATTFDPSQALGTINSSIIPAAATGGLSSTDLAPNTFGEASVDLSALLAGQTGCTTYGSVYLKSRASDSFSSELKDYISPEPVSISNCGSVKIHKTDAHGALAGAGFTLYKSQSDLTAVGSCTTALVTGECSIPNLTPADYWLVETTVPAGHDAAASQTVTVTGPDQVTSVSLVDPIQTGTITVTKDAVPDDPQDFSFQLDGGTAVPLDDDSDATLSNTHSWTVPVGAHTLQETSIPADWALTHLVCTDQSATISLVNATATFSLAKNETVACTYTDAFTKVHPTLTTQASVATANQSWNDTATLTGDGTHLLAGSVAFYACAPQATATACTTGGTKVGADVPVTSSAGVTTEATTAPYAPTAAGWTCFRAEFTSTSSYYSNQTHTNATTECFLKQAQDLSVSTTAVPTYGRDYHWTIAKTVDKSEVDIPAAGTASSHYTVTVGNSHTDSAWTLSGVITVTNPNPVAISGVTVTDAVSNGGTCVVTNGTSVTVPASSQLTRSYQCSYAAAPSPLAGLDTATVTWSPAAAFTPDGTASGTHAADFTGVATTTTDQVVSLTDTAFGALSPATLDAATAANPKVIQYTVDRSGVAGTCTTYPNTATFTSNDSAATGSASASVDVCVGADLGVATSATATKARDDLWSLTKDVDQTRVEMASGGVATFHYTVTAAPAGSRDSNYALSGTVTVTNPNDWEDITATITESASSGLGATCVVTGGTDVVIPHSGQVVLPYTCSLAGTPSSGTVTGTATWNAVTATTPHGTASGSGPATFTVTTETHKTVTVVDDKTDPANPVTLGVIDHADGIHVFHYSLDKTGVAGTCTDYTNTASLQGLGQAASRTVEVCVGVDLTVTKTALATNHVTYLWSLAKAADTTRQSIGGGNARFTYTVTASPAGSTPSGWSVTGQITVTNPNDWEAVTADITDVVDSGGGPTCLVGNGSAVTIDAGASVTLSYACTFASQPANGTNTATATWSSERASTPHGSATGTAPVVFVPTSSTNRTVTVVDDKTDPANPVTLGTATWGNGPTTFTYTVDKPGVAGACTDYTNTAMISETRQSASKVVTVCEGAALTAAATADGSYARDYLWSIGKAVDQTLVTLADGKSATFTYTVTATPGATADSAQQLAGSVTVVNPNDWEAVVADVTVTTDLATDAVCTVTDGVARSVPQGGELVLPYSCTFTTPPTLAGTVTATATWDAAAAATAVGTADNTVPAQLALTSETHKTVTVTDDKTDPTKVVTLGTATWGATPTDFTYSLTKQAAGGTCATYTNTAALADTDQSATATVQLCGITGGGGTITPVTPPVTGGGGGLLPFTGDLNGVLGRWGLAMLFAGMLLLLGARKRQA
jgi:hypothetical protein